MDNHNKEKDDLEKGAINWFLLRYNELKGEKLYLHKKQERPDVILKSDDGRELGVEIGHLYFNENEAKASLGRLDKQMVGAHNIYELIKKLNKLLEKKAKKSYEYRRDSGDLPISLLIRAGSPIFFSTDFKRHIKKIVIPHNEFMDIWLLVEEETDDYRNRSYELIHLYGANEKKL